MLMASHVIAAACAVEAASSRLDVRCCNPPEQTEDAALRRRCLVIWGSFVIASNSHSPGPLRAGTTPIVSWSWSAGVVLRIPFAEHALQLDEFCKRCSHL